MNYRILTNKSKTKTQLRRSILKWVIYIACMLVFYSFMRSGALNVWQPFLIIPLAVSVALHERELPSCLFALFCGYFIDIACRNLFGFTAIWLMLSCLAASLLSRNFIHVNLINFIWISFCTVLLQFSMDFLFNTLIWDIPNKILLLNKSILPSAVSTFLLSPLIFLFVKWIYNKLEAVNPLANYYAETNINDNDMISKD